MKKRIILILLISCLVATGIVGAEVFTGTLSEDNYSQQTFTVAGASTNYLPPNIMKVKDIESLQSLELIIREETELASHFDIGAPQSASTGITAKTEDGKVTIFTGQFGYVRNWNIFGVETVGYQYININFFNNSHGLTGNKILDLYYDHNKTYNIEMYGVPNAVFPPSSGQICFGVIAGNVVGIRGYYTNTKRITTQLQYTIESPTGIGIVGNISRSIGGTIYPSRVLVYNATSKQILTAESAQNSNPTWSFSLFSAPIYLSLITPVPTTINTSTFFTAYVPPVYARVTTLYAIDGNTGSKIVGATLAVKDATTGVWTNGTSSVSGLTVNTPYGNAIDIYGTYPGVYTGSSEVGAAAGGEYYLPMYPPVPAAPIGFVNIFVNVQDSSTNNIVDYAMVTFRLPSGATTGESTGTSGSVQYVAPNQTVIIIGLSKIGYTSISESLNSGPGPDVSRTIKLSRSTITTIPTVTNIYGTVITTIPTIDSRTDAEKDKEMMGQLRDAGPGLISLCILAIIFGIFRMISK
jgi:hypothetical protein